MKYELRAADGSKDVVASADLADHFAAESWARDWVKSQATGDTYQLKGVEGDFARSLFKTKAGQWYLTPVPVEPASAPLTAAAA